MVDAHIREGDIALIEKKDFARDRDTVVACHEDGNVIMSFFRREGADLEFIPANDRYDRRKHAADEIDILGVFRGLLRPPA